MRPARKKETLNVKKEIALPQPVLEGLNSRAGELLLSG